MEKNLGQLVDQPVVFFKFSRISSLDKAVP